MRAGCWLAGCVFALFANDHSQKAPNLELSLVKSHSYDPAARVVSFKSAKASLALPVGPVAGDG